MRLSCLVVILVKMMMMKKRDKMSMRRKKGQGQMYQTQRTCSGIRSTRLTCELKVWLVVAGVVILIIHTGRCC